MTVSVVISARNEFPNIVHTLHSIINDLETFLGWEEFEIIVVDNLSDDEHTAARVNGGTVDFLRLRGAYSRGIVKVLYDPIGGNVSARSRGAKIATGDYLFFSDAHMSYRLGSFARMVKTIEESGGMVHPAVSWMGSYPPEPVFQYSWQLGAEFDGLWNDQRVADEWFYVPAMGHCCLGMRRQQFVDHMGYPASLRTYGGGGMTLAMKWWMLGSCVVTEPRAMAYHLNAERQYRYTRESYIHNLLLSALSLGADAWAERVYLNYLRDGKRDVADVLWSDAEWESQADRTFVARRAVMSFNEAIVQRPWDERNDRRFGRHASGMVIEHDRWLALIKGTPAETLYSGCHQRQLAMLIETQLSEFVPK